MDGRGGFRILSAHEADRSRVVISDWTGWADAKLVAVAPDLLAALKECVDALGLATTPIPADRLIVLSALDYARKTIAKAEGRTE